ncbi:MAG: hypothetical protein CVV27_01635, partial [Candidatus Melainabacteria bacterium HGW-Melainabacteria-1]
MLPLQQAQNLVLEQIYPLPRQLPLDQAFGLVLAEAVASPQLSPPFDNSAMDGFAIQGPFDPPRPRQVIGSIAAGQVWEAKWGKDQALRIMTGALVPAAAEAVVPIEQVQEQDGSLTVLAPIRLGQHIRRAGEEFKPGDPLLPVGTQLNPAAIGLLASVGLAQVSVFNRPKVAILATGSELLPVAAELQAGKLRDSNSYTLAAAVAAAGGEPVRFGIVPDDPQALRQALEVALSSCDLVLSSGGVSVGDFDYVQDILLDMGLTKIFWKVAIKPGKPVLFGTLNGKPIFGIPGNPASALTVFEVLVRPALRKWMGQTELYRPRVSGTLTAPIQADPKRLHLLRLIHTAGQFEPLKGQSSSNLLSVARANALLAV